MSDIEKILLGIPHKCGISVEIDTQDSGLVEELGGCYCFDMNKIILAKDCDREVVIHEFLEAITNLYALELRHNDIVDMTTALEKLLKWYDQVRITYNKEKRVSK